MLIAPTISQPLLIHSEPIHCQLLTPSIPPTFLSELPIMQPDDFRVILCEVKTRARRTIIFSRPIITFNTIRLAASPGLIRWKSEGWGHVLSFGLQIKADSFGRDFV